MTQTPPFVPQPQPELVAFLELVLERARKGEVPFFVGSAALTPPDEPSGLDVRAYAAIGSRVERWAPAARNAAYATTLEGLGSAAERLDASMGPHRPKIVE